MSADEKLIEVTNNIRIAIDSLHDIVVNEEYGWSDYTDDYKETLTESYYTLIKLKNKL
jgi:hypothetical protein